MTMIVVVTVRRFAGIPGQLRLSGAVVAVAGAASVAITVVIAIVIIAIFGRNDRLLSMLGNEVLDEFYGPFKQAVDEAKGKILEHAEKCPLCGKPLAEKFSKRGRFFGCSGYPECKYVKRGNGDVERPQAEMTDVPCPT